MKCLHDKLRFQKLANSIIGLGLWTIEVLSFVTRLLHNEKLATPI